MRDAEGKPFTVRYDEVNAMLLNEFLKEYRHGREQDCKIKQLEATVGKMQSLIERQAAQLQTVAERVDLQRPAAGRLASD